MNLAFFQKFFQGGQNLLLCKFLLLCYCFRTKFQGGVKVFRGGKLPQGGAPLPPPVEESQELLYGDYKKITLFQNPVQKIPMINQSQNNIFFFTNYKHSLLPGKRIGHDEFLFVI